MITKIAANLIQSPTLSPMGYEIEGTPVWCEIEEQQPVK